ncbi:MAG: DUF4339 domain-containing protein [Pirellulaceae bacterium]
MAKVGGEEYGPFTWDQMLQMAAEGRVTPDLPVRQASDAEWSTAAAIPGLLGGAKPAPPRPAARPSTKAAAASGKSAVKKARPLGPPPISRPAPPIVVPPQNIPTGIPVGSPVGVALGSAPATFVAPPPVAASPSGAFTFDLGTSPSGKQRSAKKSVLDADDEVVTRKKNNTPLIVGVGGGVAALIAVIAGLTIYITMGMGGNDVKAASTNTSTGKKTPKVEQGESNPGGAIMPEGEGETDARKPAAGVQKAEKDSSPNKAAQLTALKGIRKWSNAATLVSLKVGNAKICVNRIWMSTDAGGKSIPAAVDEPKGDSTDGSAEATPAATSAENGQQKSVFVEVTVTNIAGATLRYKGWNIAKNKVPFIADDEDRILKLIPISETPGVARLTKADIPGSSSISDILVFEAPAESFEKLRLMLPQNVFYDNTTNPYSGIEITPDVLKNEGGPPVAPPPPIGIAGDEAIDPLVSGRKVPLDPSTPESPAETTKPQPKPVVKSEEPPPPKKPSLIDEINKDFEEREKTKKMDEGKGAEPETKPEPAKKSGPATKTEPAKKTVPAKGKK